MNQLASYQQQIYDLHYRIEMLNNEAHYQKAAELKYRELPKLEQLKDDLERNIANDKNQLVHNRVTREDISYLIAK